MKLSSLATILLSTVLAISAVPIEGENNANSIGQTPSSSSPSNIVKGNHFDRVVIFIFENENYAAVHSDPYFGSLAAKHNGVELSNFFALTHPSQPNYIGLISGSTSGVFMDFESNINRNSIVDLLEAKGITWKSYQQAYTGNCDTSMRIGTYARKHNPFMSMVNIHNNATRCANIVNADQLDVDIKNNQVPQFAFYTPDMNNCGHDTSLQYASNWFKGFLEPRITNTNFTENTMFVSTWDEAKDYLIPNQIQTVLFGPSFKRSSTAATDATKYDHYSLLRTIEDNVIHIQK
ncbi:phosphoesterase family-domain-containing protein [Halteromyces radiatus]|uniref:phosphoesterase family-domain-containing protein n=1 Tax=Halteromyces radiatus TaxID=101107 RepID=UPI00221EA064|nr:phosphoesterase family-domain-containing protein [Halteromyces radiatus]KAI8079978.1 phosphoesterase family-domain-containing protein [Halteromyces radiatus]